VIDAERIASLEQQLAELRRVNQTWIKRTREAQAARAELEAQVMDFLNYSASPTIMPNPETTLATLIQRAQNLKEYLNGDGISDPDHAGHGH
jgi:hypothetical protein